MARTKQTQRKSETSSRYKRARFKGRKKRDYTPEPSHPDNPCPSQVIGADSGCNLCFPDIKCHPGERHVCRQIWAGEHFRTSKALQLCRQQQQQLEDEMRLALGHNNGSTAQGGTLTLMAVPTMASTGTLGSSSSSQSNSTSSRGRPQSFCSSCNAPILDANENQAKHKHSQHCHHKGAGYPPNLQSSMLCHDCSGPSTSRNAQNQLKRGLDASVEHTNKKKSCENQRETSSTSSSENVTDNHYLNYNVSTERQDIFNAPTSTESSSEDETKTQSAKTAYQQCQLSLDQWKSIDEEEEEVVAGTAPLINSAETDVPDWRTDKPTALIQFQYLLENQLYVDCSLIVTYNGERQEFPCHKLVLARASSLLAKFLYRGETPINELLLGEFQPQAVSLMLQFIYSDRIRLKGVSSALAVCAVASHFKITSLLAACCSYINRKVSPFTVCQVLKFITDCQYELPELQKSCLKILKKNTELVLDCPEFLQCDRFILELIVQQQELNISSELVLINACAKWAKHQNGSASHIEALGPVRQYLRFLSLSASQFAEGPAQSSIVSQEEKLAIFVALASNNSEKSECALPGGLSMDRRPRPKPQFNLQQSD